MMTGRVAARGWRRVTRPSPIWRKVGKRFKIGHRAAFLIGMGTIFISLGLGILLTNVPENPLLFHTQLPEWLRVTIWCGAGILAIAFARDYRLQWIGFAALQFPAVERFASYASGVVRDSLATGGPPVPWPYLNGAFLYFALLFITRLVSSWPDPPTDEQE